MWLLLPRFFLGMSTNLKFHIDIEAVHIDMEFFICLEKNNYSGT
jgi:hypothetical protein